MSDHIEQRLSFKLTQYHIISPLNISKHESTKEKVGVRSSTSQRGSHPWFSVQWNLRASTTPRVPS